MGTIWTWAVLFAARGGGGRRRGGGGIDFGGVDSLLGAAALGIGLLILLIWSVYQTSRSRVTSQMSRGLGPSAGLHASGTVISGVSPPSAAIPLDNWERLRIDPADSLARHNLLEFTKRELEKKIVGPKVVGYTRSDSDVSLRRSRLQYEVRLSVHVETDRQGFELAVAALGFLVRVTTPSDVRIPWDDMFEKVCQIDKIVINSKKYKSRPLSFDRQQGTPTGLQIERRPL